MGILVAMISNLQLTLSRISQAARWEVYKNRVAMPSGFRGGERTIQFTDVQSLEREKGVTGEKVVVTLR